MKIGPIAVPSPIAGAYEEVNGPHEAAPHRRWPINLLGVSFENLNLAEAVKRIDEMILSKRPHYVVTANVDFLVQAQRDAELRRILLEANMVLCDGTPLVWSSRCLGNRLAERVAGSDLVPVLLAAAAERGHRVFLLGAKPKVAEAATIRLRQKHPSLIIAGHYSPPFSKLLEMDYAEISLRVRAVRPDIVLVSFGCPKQEKWIAKNYRQLGVPVLIGVGATLDFIAGSLKRAPAIMQRTGTECIYRLAQEPRRLFTRYAGDLLHFVPAITRQYWNLRTPSRSHSPKLEVKITDRDPDHWRITVEGDLCAAGLKAHTEIADEAMQPTVNCQLDLSGVRFIDSTGVALLVQWHRRLRDKGLDLLIENPSDAVRHTLEILNLGEYLLIKDLGKLRLRESTPSRDNDVVIPPYPGGHTLAWQGEITSAHAEIVWAQTVHHFAAVGAPPRRTYIINITRLKFIDSAGAELMNRIYLWSRRAGKKIRYIGPQPAVINVLQLSGLGHLLETKN